MMEGPPPAAPLSAGSLSAAPQSAGAERVPASLTRMGRISRMRPPGGREVVVLVPRSAPTRAGRVSLLAGVAVAQESVAKVSRSEEHAP